ncbi:hypothetical protein E2F43_08310 [Seongchinamella unica]|uniref:Porin n=1 Tax=Seongchinamella unica TaxID=2547392 RepID=A0A4R5LRR1_9GAMM|nr:porin [Seongchinamella unica]TDG13530.1 hypothetical protein E2F43_08310 [Seongchinamella unica]
MTVATRLLPVLCLITLPSPVTLAQADYDKIWSHFILYESEDEGLIRSFALAGRLQGDLAWVNADQGNFNDQLWRRFRFGFKSLLANDWVLQLEGDFDLNQTGTDLYRGLTDAYIGWNPGDALDLRFLKHSAGFTLDGATSSKKLLTMERNNLSNNLWFTAEYFSGVSAQGKLDNGLSYRAGVFSGDPDEEIQFQDGSYFTLASLGWDFAAGTGMETATVRIDYVYQDEDPDNNTRDFSHVFNLVSQWGTENWGLWTDLSAGRGLAGQSDIWGLVVMPFYHSSDNVQWVARYTYLDSDEANGLRLGRYERDVVGGRGDGYDEVYLGVNYLFYGHKLKWQGGLQWARMEDSAADGGSYKGWAFSTGFRLYWY